MRYLALLLVSIFLVACPQQQDLKPMENFKNKDVAVSLHGSHTQGGINGKLTEIGEDYILLEADEPGVRGNKVYIPAESIRFVILKD